MYSLSAQGDADGSEVGMRKLLFFTAIVAVAAGMSAPTVAADPPEHLTFMDDATFQSGFLTATCGTPVFITIQGIVKITLRTDRNGVLHEIDTFTDHSITFSAPATGGSTSYKFGPAVFVYPEGVFIGAPSIVTLTGVDTNFAGAPAEAGRTVIVGEVVDVTPEGVPIVDFVGPTLFEAGNQLDGAESVANLCAALTG
jgi:hypothetical protein